MGDVHGDGGGTDGENGVGGGLGVICRGLHVRGEGGASAISATKGRQAMWEEACGEIEASAIGYTTGRQGVWWKAWDEIESADI